MTSTRVMRLFVAIRPDDHVVTELSEQLGDVATRFPYLRWAPEYQLHATLVFLGDVTERAAKGLREEMAVPCAATAPATIRVAGMGHFGRSTLWAGLDGDTGPLDELQQQLVSIARSNDVPVPERAWVPHVTVARARRGGDVRGALPHLRCLSTQSWTVREVQIMQSTVHAGGARYHEFAGLPLRAP